MGNGGEYRTKLTLAVHACSARGKWVKEESIGMACMKVCIIIIIMDDN